MPPKRKHKPYDIDHRATTLTFAAAGENSTSSEVIGDASVEGFSAEDLRRAEVNLKERGFQPVLYRLDKVSGAPPRAAPAAVLLVPNAVDGLLGAHGGLALEEYLSSDAHPRQTQKMIKST